VESEEQEKPTVDSIDDASPAALLIVIDEEYPFPGPPAGHAALKPYEDLMQRLIERTTASDRQGVADVTANARKILREEHGIEMSCLEIMKGVDESIADSIAGEWSYAEATAVWLTLVSEMD